MAINNLDTLVAAMVLGPRSNFLKYAASPTIVGTEASYYFVPGIPTSPVAPPASASVCDDSLPSIPLPARTGGQNRVIAGIEIFNSVPNALMILEDRLAHMGGLNGTLTTAQTVGIDLSALTASNFQQRKGLADFSEVEWYLEWYTNTGSTAAVAPTANVTYADNTTGTAGIFNLGTAALPGTVPGGRRYKIVPNAAKQIKSIQSVALNASTGAVGNFGVTASRRLGAFSCTQINVPSKFDWTGTYAAEVFDQSCLQFAASCTSTTSGYMGGNIYWAVG
jgi:hypothetical protein